MKGQVAKRLIVPLSIGVALVAFVAGFGPIAGYFTPTAAYAIDDGFELSHFKCYSVEQRTELDDLTVSLLDQFSPTTPTTHELKKAKLLCNPAVKGLVDSVGPGSLPFLGDHLVCYEITEKDEPAHDKDFRVTNQFTVELGSSGQIVRVKETKLLCVPSLKFPFDLE